MEVLGPLHCRHCPGRERALPGCGMMKMQISLHLWLDAIPWTRSDWVDEGKSVAKSQRMLREDIVSVHGAPGEILCTDVGQLTFTSSQFHGVRGTAGRVAARCMPVACPTARVLSSVHGAPGEVCTGLRQLTLIRSRNYVHCVRETADRVEGPAQVCPAV